MNENEPPPIHELTEEEITRRKFLSMIGFAAGIAGAVLVGVPVVGFLLSPLFKRPAPVWRQVGDINSFKVGDTVAVDYLDPSPLPWAGVTAKTAAWLRRVSQTEFIAFSVNCTHLGCPVRWLADAQLFLCPCHGGVYNKDGVPVAGPPPLPLTHYPVRVNNGQVEIETSPIPITRF